jgi:hypothetical protein
MLPSKKTLVIAGAALVGGLVALAAYGRATTRAEMKADPLFAAQVVDQMTVRDQLTAGARALVGRSPLGYQGIAEVTA